jgi:DDE superfamily endonuclease
MEVSALGLIELDETPPTLALTPGESEARAEPLLQYHAEFAPLSSRQAQAHWGEKYLQGLRRPLERKALEPLARALAGGNVPARQPFLGPGPWQAAALWPPQGPWVHETRGENDGVCIVASAACPQHGEPSVGGARQWCGRVGQVDHWQSGVVAADASRQGATRLDRRRSRPAEGFEAAPRQRWPRWGRPEETRFPTTQTLALEMLQTLGTTGTWRCRGVTGAEAFGRAGACLDGGAARRRWDCAAVPPDTQGWRSRPAPAGPPWAGRGRRPRKARLVPGARAPQRVAPRAAAVPPDAWHAFRSKEGSKGPLVAECAFPRGVAVRAGWPGPEVGSVWRRTWGEAPARQGSLRHAPGHMPGTALVRVAGMRWPLETAFAESQGAWGLDHDEVRSGVGWPPPMTRGLWAQHCLGRPRLLVHRGRRR